MWRIFDPAPAAKPVAEERSARPLAYQLALAERDAKAKAASKDDSPKKADIPAFETVTTPSELKTTRQDGVEDPFTVAALPLEGSMDAQDWPGQAATAQGDPSQGDSSRGDSSRGDPSQGDPSQDFAALPVPAPYDGVPPPPGEAGPGQPGTDGAEQWRDERDPPWAYGPPRRGDPRGGPYGPPPQAGRYPPFDPYGEPTPGDPYASARGGQDPTEWADQNTEEWVEVMISGAAMRATASEDAPMLFAFPYGRNLKVVSRYEGWIEVTDPQSAATGWMQSHVVAPSGANRGRYGQGQAYYDDRPQREGGWFRRNADGFGSMINWAFGGN